MEDQDDLFIPSQVGDIHKSVLISPNPSRNKDGGGDFLSLDPQPRRSTRGHVLHRHFDIYGEALMTILQDNDEPNTIKEAFIIS